MSADTRNGILMAQNIEKAYDAKDVCFAPDPLRDDRLLLWVLNPDIRNNRIADIDTAKMFSEVDGKYMKLSKDPKQLPFLRILSFHYQLATAAAWPWRAISRWRASLPTSCKRSSTSGWSPMAVHHGCWRGSSARPAPPR